MLRDTGMYFGCVNGSKVISNLQGGGVPIKG